MDVNVENEVYPMVTAPKLEQCGYSTQKITMHRACPSCDRDNAESPPLVYSWHMWILKQCAGCRFVYLENPPDYSGFAGEFSWEKNHGDRRQRMDSEYRLTSAASRLVRRLKRLFPKKPDKLARRVKRWFPPGAVLDVGCGDGRHLENLPECYKLVGSDSMDGVIIQSFLEHETHPTDLLAEVVRTLTERGRVIIKVPNYACVNRRIMGPRWCGFHFPGHVNYFTPASLTSMVEKAGMRILSFSWLDHFWFSDTMWLVAQRVSSSTAK